MTLAAKAKSKACMRLPRRTPLLLAACVLLAFAPSARGEDPAASGRRLTDQEKRGKTIYLRGVSDAGRTIMAKFGEGSVQVPASALRCVNCHGYQGEGRPEGGVTPSVITWSALTKPYNVKHVSGREFPAYDDRALIKAIATGVDSGGNRLAVAMPRYALTHKEAADLVAYIKCLGEVSDSGLSDDRITIGVLLPQGDPAAADAVRSVLQAYFDDLNEAGGIYNRRIAVAFVSAGATPQESVAAVRELILDKKVFALCTAFVSGAEKEIAELADQEEVPVIGAVTDFPWIEAPPNRHVFYLFSGAEMMTRALVAFALREKEASSMKFAIVSADSPSAQNLSDSVIDQFQRSEPGFVEPVRFPLPESAPEARRLTDQLKSEGVTGLFLLATPEEQLTLLEEFDRQSFHPDLFVPGPLISGRLFRREGGKTLISFARGPDDQKEEAVQVFRDFAQRHGLGSAALSLQVDAYCSAKILTEALKRSGKSVNRDGLLTSMEGLYEYHTGLTPPISFGPNRRIGARGAYIAIFDQETKKCIPASDWIPIP